MQTPNPDAAIFSLIVPTRGRVGQLGKFLDSLADTAVSLSNIEVILVVDADDTPTLAYRHSRVEFKLVAVPQGLSMGALNQAGYLASAGRYIMLLNDDVVARTSAWDEKLLKVVNGFDDEIFLAHVNDLIFRETLCTFPLVSRTYCDLSGGVCPDEYARYRIDDHIYNVFNLLGILGQVRIVYLPDIVFEHTNTVFADGAREYVPNPAIHASDTKIFDRLLPQRKKLAVTLAFHIDARATRERSVIREQVLAPIMDSVSLRRPDLRRVTGPGSPLSSETVRVTIGVVTADINSGHARTCIDAIKKFTSNYELVIIDNNRGPNFNHSREMNRLLSICKTDFLVLMDDDVFVEPGWLDGILRCMAPEVGVVTPMHKDINGSLSYSGIVMGPDKDGTHTHMFDVPDRPRQSQSLCSAVMLIDIQKCGHILVDESYSKYFLDIDFGLRIWEAGFQVLVSPYSMVTHVGGGTLQQDSQTAAKLFEVQRQHFVDVWIATGRYHRLESAVWQGIPQIKRILAIPDEFAIGLNGCLANDHSQHARQLINNIYSEIGALPALRLWCDAYAQSFVKKRAAEASASAPHIQTTLQWIASHADSAVQFHADIDGFSISVWHGTFYAIPSGEGPFNPDRFFRHGYKRQHYADDLDLLYQRIRLGLHTAPKPPPQAASSYPLGSSKSWSRHWPVRLARSIFHEISAEYFRTESVFRSLTLLGKRRNLRKIFIDTFGQETAHRWYLKYRQLRMGENRSRPSSASPVEPRIANADPRQWLKASPLTALADRYLGYRIYRYEFKYFAVPDTAPEFDYQRFISGTYPVSPLIALSLSDAKRLIDSSTTPTKARTALFKVFPDSRVHTDIVICARDTGPAVPASPNHILVNAQDLLSWARMASAIEIEALQSDFGTRAIDTSIIPWRFPDSWQDNSLEVVAGQLAPNIEIVQMTGSSRVYSGEDKHRLLYNKAYLSSMFQVIPSPAGKKVLEVGCSDGLVCDIFNQLGATEIHGIDVMATVGCGFRDSGIIYRSMDAAQLSFDAQSFDICCSIATLEHVPDPYKVLIEMLRVTRIGGYVYVQAAPLYHSPFGHHMFGYFQDIPWIHLRMTPNQIISLAKMRGIDKTIEGDHCLAVEEYIHEMLSPDHVNGLLLHDYRLDEFSRRSDIRILKLDYSEEGDNLLTQQILSEVRDVSRSDLTAHGFEIAFQRLS